MLLWRIESDPSGNALWLPCGSVEPGDAGHHRQPSSTMVSVSRGTKVDVHISWVQYWQPMVGNIVENLVLAAALKMAAYTVCPGLLVSAQGPCPTTTHNVLGHHLCILSVPWEVT